MFSLVAPIDDEIVSDDERSFAALDDLRNDVLVLLRGAVADPGFESRGAWNFKTQNL